MNAYYRAIAQVANALVALWRWAWGWREDAGYVPPVVQHHTVSVEAQAAAWAFPAPAGRMSQWSDLPKVNLWKAPNLVRPFVETVDCAMRWVATARVPSLDELGLPMAPMANDDTPMLGIFDQAREAWRIRTGNRDVSWA